MISSPSYRLTIKQATPPQKRFWTDSARWRAFVGGVGSGKTFAGCWEVLRQPPNTIGMVVSPTYPMLRDTVVRTFKELTLNVDIVKSFNTSTMTAELIGNRTILFRSADNPDRLRGPNLGWVWIDEAGYVDYETWLVCIGRLRREPGRLWITTTPRGKRHWLYTDLVKTGKVSLTQAATASNTFNPADFVGSLESAYSADWQRQELLGEFIEPSGTVFQRQWFEIVDSAPADKMIVRAWDCAATPNSGDSTVGTRMIKDGDDYYIDHVVAAQLGPADVDRLIVQTAAADGHGVQTIIEEEGGSSGKRANEHIINRLNGYIVHSERVTGPKLTRAMPMAREASRGRVKLVKGDWNQAWLDEVCSFTGEDSKNSYHDDRVDSASLAFNFLNKIQPFVWFS